MAVNKVALQRSLDETGVLIFCPTSVKLLHLSNFSELSANGAHRKDFCSHHLRARQPRTHNTQHNTIITMAMFVAPSAGHILMPQWGEQQAACPHWTPCNSASMICGMTAKFCYQLSKSLSIYPPPHTTSSKLLLITRSTIPTLRVRIVRQRQRVHMSRQLCQRYAAAYPQQIILRSQPKRCCAQASDVIDHARPIIFLR